MSFHKNLRSNSFKKRHSLLSLKPLIRQLSFIHHEGATLTFAADDFEDATLVCSTPAECNKLSYGFVADSTFFYDCEIKATSLDFLHDQTLLQVKCASENFARIDFKYSSFTKLYFEIVECTTRFEVPVFDLNLTAVVDHTPMLYAKVQNLPKFTRLSGVAGNCLNGHPKFCGATAFQIFFTLTVSEFNSFFHQLYALLACPISFCSLKADKFDDTHLKAFDEIFVNWPWETRYYVEAIKSCGSVGSYLLNYHLIKHDLITSLRTFDPEWANQLFYSMYQHLKADPVLKSLDFEINELTTKSSTGGFVVIKTVYITPTRTILTLGENTMDCRGFRKVGVDNLIQVKFRDENLAWFPYDVVDEVILPYCRDGITIASKTFYEFGGSSSLFREHGAYFYAANCKTEILELWQKLGQFKIEAAAKVAARIGQYFTSARELKLKLKHENVCLIEDFLSESTDSAGKQYCYSDGVGTLSVDFATKISQELGLSYVPSAFQIRFAGYKGMISVDPDCPLFETGTYCVCLRNSQKKFDVFDDGFLDMDIVQWSAPSPARLHKEFIVMLNALATRQNRGDSFRQRVRQLMGDTFNSITNSLINKNAFYEVLEKLPKYIPVTKMSSKCLMQEPFWRSMVEAKAVLTAGLLSSKSQIPIASSLGRCAYGIVDTTGLLQHGEVFFQFSKSMLTKSQGREKIIKVGKVGVTKSPIHYMGDIRFLTAVDVPALNHLSDVIVFPRHGPRPHPDEIGGGDLDGDVYSIFWDPELLFDNVEAADYTAASVDHIEAAGMEHQQVKFAEFRVQYMKENNLEALSNVLQAHSVLHDCNHAGYQNVARKADTAVNFFKSGLAAGRLEQNERPEIWPRIMGKRHEPAFKNSHILMEVHENADTFYHLIKIAQKKAWGNRVKQQPLHCINVKIDDDRRLKFQKYKAEIQSLMTRYRVTSEGELFANALLDVPGALKNQRLSQKDDNSAIALLQRKVFEIFERYRVEVLDEFGGDGWRSEMEEKEEDIFTYQLPFAPPTMIEAAKQYYALAEEDRECLSFPWIAWEGIDAWYKSENDEQRNSDAPNKVESEIDQDFNENSISFGKEIEEKYFSKYDAFNNFINLVVTWLANENLPFCVFSKAVEYFVSQIQPANNKIKHRFGEAFIDFLMTPFANEGDAEDDTIWQNVAKATQSTLIKLAFFPQDNVFSGLNLHNQVIRYPSFVISVPSFWSEDFQKQYTILQTSCQCKEIAIGVRKSYTSYHNFTIMCRGTLESCKKVENSLTPHIEPDDSVSFEDMKRRKIKVMRDLLQKTFSFPSNTGKVNVYCKRPPAKIANKSYGKPQKNKQNYNNQYNYIPQLFHQGYRRNANGFMYNDGNNYRGQFYNLRGNGRQNRRPNRNAHYIHIN